MTRLAIIGEYRPAAPPHVAVDEVMAQAGARLGRCFTAEWVPTDRLARGAGRILAAFDGLWLAPGSPYRSTEGALAAIRFGRERMVPVLGTCGGFQHLVVEFARNVLGLREAGHAELDPAGSCLVVTPLACSAAGRRMPVQLDRGSRPETWYGRTKVREQFYCNYGLNPAFEAVVHDRGLRVVGRDPDGEPRIVDLAGHPFFIGALFVPHPSLRGPGHPLVMAWIRAAQARAATRPAGPRQSPALRTG